MTTSIKIIQPDDWHVHFREDEMLKVVTKYSSRVNRRCIAMPNTSNPITFRLYIGWKTITIGVLKNVSKISIRYLPIVMCITRPEKILLLWHRPWKNFS